MVDSTARLLSHYNYPDVGREHRVEFIAELIYLVENRKEMLEHFPFYMLKGLLQMAQSPDALPYLEDETPSCFSAYEPTFNLGPIPATVR